MEPTFWIIVTFAVGFWIGHHEGQRHKGKVMRDRFLAVANDSAARAAALAQIESNRQRAAAATYRPRASL